MLSRAHTSIMQTYVEQLEVWTANNHMIINGPFVHGGTKCTLGWNFADIFFSIASKL